MAPASMLKKVGILPLSRLALLMGGNVQSAVASVGSRDRGDMRPGTAATATIDQPTGQGGGSFRPIAALKRTFNSLGGDVLQEPVDRLSAADGRHADAAIHRGLLHL